ncbi:MAG: plastocyanin/azurin family copper-binding protein [Methylophagaceae bacterium]
MSKTKAVVATLVHIALAVFFIMAIWPALQGGSEGYNTKASGVVVNKAMEESVIEPVVEDDMSELAESEMMDEPVIESVVEDDMSEPAEAEMMDEPVVEAGEPVVDPAPTAEEATIHEVKAQVTAFSPLVIFIQPGDLVAWSNMNGHDTQSLEGLIPEGAEAWHSKLGEEYQRTFTVEGVYLYKCTPHFGTGMGGVIIVGKPTNFDAILASGQKGAAKRLVKKAKVAIEAHTF